MTPIYLKSLLIAIGLSVASANAWALLTADKTAINSSTGVATISVSFPKPISGDLYLATEVNGRLYFFAENGVRFTTDVIPFIKNSYFAVDREVLKLSSEGVPPAVYSLYQVVTVAGKSPLDINNWVGGINGLSSLQLSINLPLLTTIPVVSTPTPPVTTAPIPTLVPTPTIVPTESPSGSDCIEDKTNTAAKLFNVVREKDATSCVATTTSPVPTPSPTPAPTVDGKSTYLQYCSSCHGTNPAANVNDILHGKNSGAIANAINQNAGGVMAVLKGRLSSAQINAITNYLNAAQ